MSPSFTPHPFPRRRATDERRPIDQPLGDRDARIDRTITVLGLVMIAMTIFVAYVSNPPLTLRRDDGTRAISLQ